MALLNLEAETYAILHELDGLDPRDGVVIANAMMGAAMCFLTRLAGHDAVADGHHARLALRRGHSLAG